MSEVPEVPGTYVPESTPVIDTRSIPVDVPVHTVGESDTPPDDPEEVGS